MSLSAPKFILRTVAICIAGGVTLLMEVANVHAQGAPQQPRRTSGVMQFNGVGTHGCGVYLENMKGIQAETWKHLYQQWGAGFLAGTSNEGRGANPHTDLETYTAWLDKWCSDDPASKVASGIIALAKRLSSQR